MLDINTLLDIRYFSTPTYSDYKMSLGSAGKDTKTITLADDEYIYIGFYKPVKNIYFDLPTPNTNAGSLVIEYSNAAAGWTALTAYDETEGFTRSGLIQWEEIDEDLLGEIEIDSTTKYWIRIQPSVTNTATVYNFVGLILSNDDDLLIENPYILETNLLMGESNHLKAHVAARKEIIQTFSNQGEKKDSIDANNTANSYRINFWDMLDIQEFRQGSIFLALSKIYFNLSDKDEDTWLKKSEKYRGRYYNQINLYFKTLDKNDSGITGSPEKSAIAGNKTVSR